MTGCGVGGLVKWCCWRSRDGG